MSEIAFFSALGAIVLDMHRIHSKIQEIYGVILFVVFFLFPVFFPDDIPFLSSLVFWKAQYRWFLYVGIIVYSLFFLSYSPEHKISRISGIVIADYVLSFSHTTDDFLITVFCVVLIFFAASEEIQGRCEECIIKIIHLFSIAAAAFIWAGIQNLHMVLTVYISIMFLYGMKKIHQKTEYFLAGIIAVFLYYKLF